MIVGISYAETQTNQSPTLILVQPSVYPEKHEQNLQFLQINDQRLTSDEQFQLKLNLQIDAENDAKNFIEQIEDSDQPVKPITTNIVVIIPTKKKTYFVINCRDLT
jgi:hypothetical protein